MKEIRNPKTWLISFFAILLIAVFIIGLIAWAVDPFYQFRYCENAYFNNTAKFPGPGLVKNYDYDTLILGSSMTQNFHMDVFREKLGAKPLHIGIGGMGVEEMLAYIRLSEAAGKCDAYYLCIDQYMLTEAVTLKTPEYLFRDDPVSVMRYLLSYEAWSRYIPLDLALTAADAVQISLPSIFRQAANVDYLGNWEGDFAFGEDVVLRNYASNAYSVSEVDTDGLYDRMTRWIDHLFDGLPGDGAQYHFFFPPYSVLYWCDAENDGYMEIYAQAKGYFLEKAQAIGAEVFDFQAEDLISNLDNYKDTTHYSADINDWMTRCFASGECLLTQENLEANGQALENAVDRFAREHPELFG